MTQTLPLLYYFAATQFQMSSVPWVITCQDLLSPTHAVAQFVEALRYNTEGRGFAPRLCQWNFSLA
jgi:hypothetical protein